MAALLLCYLLVAGCAAREKRPLSALETEEVFSVLWRNDLKAENFFATGQLIIEGESYSKAPILLVGKRRPFALRIEITHPWGKPLAHMLFEQDRFILVSFQESKYYVGETWTLEAHSGFPPSLSPLELWGLARGYPPLEGLQPLPSKEGEMRVCGPDKKGEKILLLEGLIPRKAVFPSKGLEITYGNINQSAGVPFAQEVVVFNTIDGQTLTIRREQAHFNTKLQEGLFVMDIPSGFERVYVAGFGRKDPPVNKQDDL